jgi:hypothetical protein
VPCSNACNEQRLKGKETEKTPPKRGDNGSSSNDSSSGGNQFLHHQIESPPATKANQTTLAPEQTSSSGLLCGFDIVINPNDSSIVFKSNEFRLCSNTSNGQRFEGNKKEKPMPERGDNDGDNNVGGNDDGNNSDGSSGRRQR